MTRWSWGRRFTGAGALGVLLLVVGAPAAFAKGLGQTPAALMWIDLKDSRGISLWHHELSLDRGGPLAPDKFFWAAMTDQAWGFYRSYVAIAIWFLDWVLSFQWLGVLAAPLLVVGDAFSAVVAQLGLGVTFLTITAVVAGLFVLRGKVVTGVWELLMACVIAVLATGAFANPVQLVAGDHGYIRQANQLGQEIAGQFTTGDAHGKSPEQLRAAQVGKMVDVFIRQPTQMINYGSVIDGGKCEGAYNDVVRDGPYGQASTIRDKIAGCDKTLGDYAAQPTGAMATSALVFQPAGMLVLALAVVLAGSVVAAGAWALFQSVKAIWALVQGILPGGARGSLLVTVAGIVEALAAVVIANIFLAVFLLVLQALFGQSSADEIGRTFVIADVLIAVAIVVWLRARKKLKEMSARLAQWMAQRPGGSPTQLPAPGQRSNVLGSAVRTVANLGQWRATAMAGRAGGMSLVDARQQAAFFGMGGAGENTVGGGYAVQQPSAQPSGASTGRPGVTGGPVRPELLAGPGAPALGRGPEPRGPLPSGGGRALELVAGPSAGLARVQRAGKAGAVRGLVKVAAQAAAAYATGGASTVLTGASKAGLAIRTARRVALTARLARAAVQQARPAARPATPSGAPVVPTVTGRVLDPAPARPGEGGRPPRRSDTRVLDATRATAQTRAAHTQAAAQLRARLANRARRGR